MMIITKIINIYLRLNLKKINQFLKCFYIYLEGHGKHYVAKSFLPATLELINAIPAVCKNEEVGVEKDIKTVQKYYYQ